MKKTALLTAVLMMATTLGSSTATARGRQTTGNNNTPAATASRPGSQAVDNNSQRPGTASQRPGTPNTRPTMPQQPARPTTPVPPPPPQYKPSMPHTPPNYNYYRPTPRPSWRPPAGAFSFNRILGLTLGSLLSNSINSLFNSGYNVTGYTNNNVYLRDVNYCNVTWPEATLYYNNGYLQGSVFSASSYAYDPTRYNYVYNYLTTHYGMPVSSQNLSAGGMSCTWWGGSNTYLTLSFYPETTYGGIRYFTTLSTGY